MKKLLLSTAALLGLSIPALAQVNTVPQVGLNTNTLRQNTYSAVFTGLVPAASATDIFCLNGSATKDIHVIRVEISGTAGTLITTPVTLLRRVSLDTGTAATATYVPGIVPLYIANPTATASVTGYNTTGGNPTIVDTTPTYYRVGEVTLGVSGTTAAPADHLVWRFGSDVDNYAQRLIIGAGNTTKQLCLNLGAVSVTTGALYGQIDWMEY